MPKIRLRLRTAMIAIVVIALALAVWVFRDQPEARYREYCRRVADWHETRAKIVDQNAPIKGDAVLRILADSHRREAARYRRKAGLDFRGMLQDERADRLKAIGEWKHPPRGEDRFPPIFTTLDGTPSAVQIYVCK